MKMIDDGVTSTMGKFMSMGDRLAAKFGGMQAQMDKFTAGVRKAANEVPGLNRVIELATNPYVAVTAGVVGLGVALGSSVGSALTFEKGLAQANTTARLGIKDLAGLRDRLIDLGSNSTTPLAQVPAAFNQIISAVGDSDKALAILGPALKGAQAGFTDVKTVSEALVNVMGAVGDATPTDVLNTLFATVRVGKGEFSDFANYLPKIIPLANNVGIAYQEVAGAFALLTSKGQTAEQSAMLLQNAMVALSKPKVTDAFEKSGVAIFDNAGKMRNLTTIIADLSKKTNGLSDKQKQTFLAGLGLDAQAAAGFSVLAQNSATLKSMVGETTQSAGELDAALRLSGNTSDRIALAWNRLSGAMLKIGYGLLPYVNAGLDLLSAGFTWAEQSLGGLQATVTGVGAGVGAMLAVLATQFIMTGIAGVASTMSTVGATFMLQYALLSVRTALYSIPFIGWAALGVAALVGFWTYSEKFRASVAGIGGVLFALMDPIKLLGVAIANIFNPAAFAANMLAFVQSVRNLDLKGAFNNEYDASMRSSLADAAQAAGGKKSALAGLNLPKGPAAPGAPSGGAGTVKDGLKAVTDGGRQVRNVVVNINGGLVKEVRVINGTSQASGRDLEEFIKETLIRAVNGAEQALQY